jgi:signal transduction histidine kinase
MILGDAALLIRALQALLETAVKLSNPGGRVRVSVTSGASETECVIETRGSSVPADVLPRFFGLFSVSETIVPGGDLGLGPPVAERVIRLMGGAVRIENREPAGVRLTITLKSAPANPEVAGSPSSPLAGGVVSGAGQ